MKISEWITASENNGKAIYFRNEFNLKEFKEVYLDVTALGWAKVYINGKLVTEEEFLPGWTDYTKRVPLFKYDITKFLVEGRNVIGAIVGNGWACGEIGWGEWRKYYNINTPCLYAKIQYKDSLENISDINLQNWVYGEGIIQENDIYAGETQNWLDYTGDFSLIDFNCANWQPAIKCKKEVVAEINEMPKVLVKEILEGELIKQVNNKHLYDFKQNFAGVIRLCVEAKTESVITIQHAEILDESDNICLKSIRGAKAQDKYILKSGTYILRPYFTYHGFRYAEISVEKGEVVIQKCEGLAIYTNAELCGKFETSSNLINKIM